MTAGDGRVRDLGPARSRVIEPVPGFAPLVGTLVSMMRLVRQDTLDLAAGVDDGELARRVYPNTNSIGMLLGHVAALERITVLRHLERRDPTPAESAWLVPRMELGEAGDTAMEGITVADHQADLLRVRVLLERSLEVVDDVRFGEPFEWRGTRVNLHRQVFHIMEDELRHMGQVRWLLKRMRAG